MRLSLLSRGFIPFLQIPIRNCVERNKRLLPVFRNFVSKGFERPSNTALGSNYLNGRNVLIAGSIKREKIDSVSGEDSQKSFEKEYNEWLRIINDALFLIGEEGDKSLVNHSETIAVIDEILMRIKEFNPVPGLNFNESSDFKTSFELSKLSISELRLEFGKSISRFYRIEIDQLIESIPDYYPYRNLYRNIVDKLSEGKVLLQLDRALRTKGVIALRPPTIEFLTLVEHVKILQQLLKNLPKKS